MRRDLEGCLVEDQGLNPLQRLCIREIRKEIVEENPLISNPHHNRMSTNPSDNEMNLNPPYNGMSTLLNFLTFQTFISFIHVDSNAASDKGLHCLLLI